MKNKLLALFVITILLALTLTGPALGQGESDGLRLRISKVFGYSSLGNTELQGSMRLWVDGPENLQRVIFSIDGEVMAEVEQAPFEVRFNTSNYELGEHRFLATGITTDGQELQSNEIRTRFVTSEQGMAVAMRILIPILAITGVAALIGILGPVLLRRGKPLDIPYGEERQYGVAGGAICPRCQRPFPLRLMAINLGPGLRIDRCPFCGKWGVMRRRSLKDLRAAEIAELEMAQKEGLAPMESEEERLRKELDRSRYLDQS